METQTITAAELAAEPMTTATPASVLTPPPQVDQAATLAPAAPPAPPAPVPTTAAHSAQGPIEKDALGRDFDPQKFAPRKDSAGRWINRNAGRKPKTPAAAEALRSYVPPDAPPPQGLPGATAPTAQAPADRFDLAAEMYTRAGYSVLDGIFSGNGEWLPENDGEHVALRGALATYLRHKQSDDLPPGLSLSLALATYSAKRFARPRTRSRLAMFGYWLRAWIYSWRTGRRLDQLPPPSPPPPPSETTQALPPQNLPPADSSSNPKP